jgi:hypothetical protein
MGALAPNFPKSYFSTVSDCDLEDKYKINIHQNMPDRKKTNNQKYK